MKHSIFNINKMLKAFVFTGLLIASTTAIAQNRTGYFLEGNLYRHNLNPAFMGERGYVSFPILGNMNIQTQGNVGYSNFIYKTNTPGYTQTTFLNSSVSANDFLSDIDDENIVRLNLDMTIFSLGFKAFGGYNTIDLNLRSRTGMSMPYEMFEFMKVMGNKHYVMEDLNMQTKNYIDLSLGHSHKINDELTIGANVKFLFGVAYADVNFDRIDVNMSGNQWLLNAKGTGNIAMGGAYTFSDELTADGRKKIDGYDDIAAGIQGFGMGLDLGATYDLSEIVTEGLTVSASITDLGFISWNKTAAASINNDEPYTFDGFSNLAIHNDSENKTLDDQFEDLQDDLEDFFNLNDDGEESVSTGIGTTFNLGVEYKMPFYKPLTAGFLFTHRFEGVYSWTEARISANIAPVDVFDAALSLGLNTYGVSAGFLANFHCTGFNLFFGTDCFMGKTTKQFIPLNDMNASVSFGINFPFAN